MIQLENVRFTWKEGETLINIPELIVSRGEKVMLRGESGCGKTTLLTLISGIQTVDSGVLKVDDIELKTLKSSKRDKFRGDHMGYIFQQFNLIPWLSIQKNILCSTTFSTLKKEREKESLDTRVEMLMAELKLDRLKDKPVRELSLGQQQRVALARALVGHPPLIIADEPTSSLDSGNRSSFMNLLVKECEKEGSTLFVVSHDSHIDDHFDRIIDFHHLNGGHND
ncbi:MAG: ABC transporter ATP-binding protein [Spirochaetales bacterium]|nr:ABC transporter ATP-binding protein [Spirochaetales bacterium]